jgi:hypothetical protein
MTLYKQCQFPGVNSQGEVLCLPLHVGGLEKNAYAMEMRSKLHPKVQDFVRAIRPTSSGIYVLVNALGAGEYWGSNVNGDLFPEKALIHAPSNWEDLLSDPEQARQVGQSWDYGFPTFMGAYPYKHHVNKDPSRAFGRVELATWNPEMHRVELVVYLDRALCMQFDAMDIIERIERGEFPDVSMGCKVPFDVCSICQNRSKTRVDYCQHALTMMNKILPDGRKVCVINTLPKFFDISFVFIGADKTAKVMAKLAQRGHYVCMGDFCTIPRMSSEVGDRFTKIADPVDEISAAPYITKEKAMEDKENALRPSILAKSKADIIKTASCDCHGFGDDCGGTIDKLTAAIFPLSNTKSASQQKLSEIIKTLPAGPFSKETLPRLERAEPNIPNGVLDTMGQGDLPSALSTPSMAGMVLKPREFQRIILVRIGEPELANELDRKGMTFGRTNEVDDSIPIEADHINGDLMDILRSLGLLKSRSAAAPAIRNRSTAAPADKPFHPIGTVDNPLMNKIAAVYNGYRRNILKKAASIADYMTTNPQLLSDLFGSSMAQAFAGGFSKVSSASVFSPDSLAYLVGAYTDRDFHLTNEVVMSLAQMGAVQIGI